jgi:CHAD domain-containing protein
MSFKIRPNEPLDKGVKRIADTRIEDSIDRLRHFKQNPDKSVHEIRKNMKKIRAVLRLIRYGIPDKRYKTLNALHRDISRQFAVVREANVNVKTLKRLKKTFELPAVARDVRKVLESQHRDTLELIQGRPEVLQKMRRRLERSKADFNRLPLDSQDFDLVRGGLKRVYKQGRAALEAAMKTKDGDHFHEWRKRVKYLWYHVRLLGFVWPPVMNGYARLLDRLSDTLGEEHDLLDLKRLFLDAEAATPSAETGIDAIVKIIDEKRTKLQSTVWTAGEKIYAEAPGMFADRTARYWHAETSTRSH